MAYQILSLRAKEFVRNGELVSRLDDSTHYANRWRFEKIEDLFSNPQKILDDNNVPNEERFNLFYTLSYCGEGKRLFGHQEILPIDIDGIDVERLDTYESVVLDELNLDKEKTAVVASGNGLHILVKLTDPIASKDYFENWRPQYQALCKRIDRALERAKLPGKPDPSIFDAARILRFPNTENIKVDKKTGEKKIRRCVVRRGTLLPQAIDLEKLSGLPKIPPSHALSEAIVRRLKETDGNAAFDACAFLKHAKTDAENLTEPEWYAAASIVGRFKGGREIFHQLSRPHSQYNEADTDFKFEQAKNNSGPRTCKNINSLWGKCSTCPHFEKISSPVQIYNKDVIPSEATGFYDVVVNKDGAPKTIPNYNDLLRAFKRDYPYKMIADMKTVYVFNGKNYVDFLMPEIKGYAEKQFEPAPQERMRAEFLHKVHANELKRRDFFNDGIESKINFSNGVLDILTNEMLAHSPDYGFRTCLPYDYDPTAKCPTFDWWIDDIMLGDKDLIKILQEFMGYVVRGGEYTYNKALWLSGSGRNGKSTFIDILKALIGTENYAVLSLKAIINDKFAGVMLDGKLANFSEETSPEELADSGPFKNLTGDGETYAQKKYGDAYQFRNKAKLIMSYNEVPILKDLSPGMVSRPIIIPFKKDLTDEASQDKTLKKRLLSELPGIFNFALEGWFRLDDQKKFSSSDKSSLEMQEIREASCSAAQWVKENITFLETDSVQPVKPRQLYEDYKKDVQYAYSEQKFYRRITMLPEIAARKAHSNGGNVYTRIALRKREL